MVIKGHKDLHVWSKAIEFVTRVYEVTRNYPRDELYGIVSQLRRAAVSIASNIAEGATPLDETKAKISATLKCRTGENNPMFGKILSEESKAKISAALKGHKRGMSGKTHSDEAKAKIGAASKAYWAKRRQKKTEEK